MFTGFAVPKVLGIIHHLSRLEGMDHILEIWVPVLGIVICNGDADRQVENTKGFHLGGLMMANFSKIRGTSFPFE
jgi:hypothetical protein